MKATKFIVWRAYHKLKKELGRVPYSTEVSADCGLDLHEGTVRNIIRHLKTCKSNKDGAEVEKVDYDNSWTSCPRDVFTYMQKRR